jgi:catechol 1,2-dioxygenase
MRVSVPNQQDLITQLYFKDGKYTDTDPWASSPNSASRILSIVKNASGQNTVNFDVVMSKEFPLDEKGYARITGLYKLNDDIIAEFTKNDDLLFMKWNGQLRASFRYVGNNSFEGGIGFSKVTFELLANGATKTAVINRGKTYSGEKFLKYGG